MADEGKRTSKSDRSSLEPRGEAKPWVRAVQGQPRQPQWTENRISNEELEELRLFFTKVLEFPEDEMAAAWKQWEEISVLVRSVGRRVPSAWMAPEFRDRRKLQYEPEAVALSEDHHLIRFQSAADCEGVLLGGPWFVADQLLAVEPWVPGFVPGVKQVRRVVVWLRLPGLPMEFWSPGMRRAIVAEAGKPVAVDEFTNNHRKAGFAKFRVELDAGEPLKPGVLIRSDRGSFAKRLHAKISGHLLLVWPHGACGRGLCLPVRDEEGWGPGAAT
uniref:Uncharacterized protein LOC105042341 n=1 Tax=Elaeis guineensis var. tenera TaxID=51953 RepID=A0A6I9R4W1_ELAGV|nr:uncharacterized protein LOC105042341 [Elaeis guineensis]